MQLVRKSLLVLAALLALGGCGPAAPSQAPAAVPSPAAPAPVTLTAFGFWADKESDIARRLQAALAERFPGITLEYEAFPTGAGPYSDELARRIAHQREADLFMTADTALGNSGALLELTDAAGRPVDLARRYTVAVSENQLIQVSDVLNLYGSAAEEVGLTLREAITAQIVEQSTIVPLLDGRIEVVQQ